MENSQDNTELHPIIERAIYEVENLEYQVGWYELFHECEIETRKKWELSEDEIQWNQNVIGYTERVDDVTINETLEQYKAHQEELEDAKILLRIYMDAFNGGWEF